MVPQAHRLVEASHLRSIASTRRESDHVDVRVSRRADAQQAHTEHRRDERETHLAHRVHEFHILPVGLWITQYPFSGGLRQGDTTTVAQIVAMQLPATPRADATAAGDDVHDNAQAPSRTATRPVTTGGGGGI